MTNPIFSIITVTRNNLSGLQKTYDSVQSQSFKNYEWLVCDGNSTDGSLSFLSQNNIEPVSTEDNGIYDAMNKGIDRAKGEYLIFMNAGDVFASKNNLETIADTIQKEEPDFIYGDALEILKDKEVYKKARYYPKIDEGMITHHQSMVYKREIIGDLIYNQKYRIAADYDYTWRIINQSKDISYIPAPLCLFETGGISQQQALKGRLEQFKIRYQMGIQFFDNIFIFAKQTAVYFLRQLSPKTYWRLKAWETKL
jgi:putative colanic acid biosynthesis glycosyltransferase